MCVCAFGACACVCLCVFIEVGDTATAQKNQITKITMWISFAFRGMVASKRCSLVLGPLMIRQEVRLRCEKIYEFVCCNALQCVAMASRGYTLLVVR